MWLLEFGQNSEDLILIAKKSDVYSLGILIMEILLGEIEMKAWKGKEYKNLNPHCVGDVSIDEL